MSKIVKQKPRGLVALHRREVVRRVNLSYVQIWKLIRAGKFPRGRKHTGTNRTIWFEHEIDAYLLQCRPQVLKGDERR